MFIIFIFCFHSGKKTKRKRNMNKLKKYECFLCKAVFKMQDTFQAHMNVHNGLPAYRFVQFHL